MGDQSTVFITEQEKQVQKEYAKKCTAVLEQRYPEFQPLCHVHSYGCQGNVSDGEKIKGILAEIGYGFTCTPDDAELVLYNTCAVRENAEDRVFGNIGELSHNKKRNPNMIVGLCGCMMQQEHIVQRIHKSYPHVGLVFGTHVLHKLPELLYLALTKRKRVFDATQSDGVIAEDLPIVRDGRFKAWLPIMYGCNNFCTYCIVPYVRGRERSREPADILKEARQLVDAGYKEITLLGQNVNSYGRNLNSEMNFSNLLQQINEIPGDFRIRFMTSHPKDATKELVDTIASCDKVCNHIHLPVQCGSDDILRRMNRGYTSDQYLELVDYAKKKIPDISLTSDIIVGFPGETYGDFLKTVDLVQKVRFDSLYTFLYSSRSGTKAAEMDDPIPQQEKSKWLRELLALQTDLGIANYEDHIGKTLRVLVDGVGKSADGFVTGRTDNNIIVDFKGTKDLIGEFANINITSAHKLALVGQIIK